MTHLPERLSPHFTLGELSVTSTGLPNTPSPHAVESLRELCVQILEPWRLVIGAIRISSGYRSPEVNLRIGGSPTSDHLHGRAADCIPRHVPLEAAWRSLAALADPTELPIDQAIVYVRPLGQGWIHVGHRATPRRELLVHVDGRYVPWSTYRGPIVSPA